MLEIVDIRDATEEEIQEFTKKQEKPEWQQGTVKNAGEDMDLGRARRIIRNIYDEETEVADKITAIQEELDAERHTAVSKEHLIEVLRWLLEEYI